MVALVRQIPMPWVMSRALSEAGLPMNDEYTSSVPLPFTAVTNASATPLNDASNASALTACQVERVSSARSVKADPRVRLSVVLDKRRRKVAFPPSAWCRVTARLR
jgi:hypothetical protein